MQVKITDTKTSGIVIERMFDILTDGDLSNAVAQTLTDARTKGIDFLDSH
jgi:hypothetical protein